MDEEIEGFNLFDTIGATVDSAVQTFVVDISTKFITGSIPVVVALLTVYLLYLGVMVASGKASFEDFARTATRMAVIGALIGSFTTYDKFIVQGYYAVENGIIGAIQGSDSEGSSATDPDSSGAENLSGNIYKELDVVVEKGLNIQNRVAVAQQNLRSWEVGRYLSYMLARLIIMLSIGLMTLLGAILIITAKVAVSTLLAIGPIFLFFLMWPATGQFFSLWVTQLWNYTFQLFFVVVFLSFSTQVSEGLVGNIIPTGDGTENETNVLIGSLQILFLGIILMYLLKQAGALAGAVAGGFGLSAITLKPLADAAKGAAKGLADRISGDKTVRRYDKDGKSHHMTQREHRRAGNRGFIGGLGNAIKSGGKDSAYFRTGGNRYPVKNSVSAGQSKAAKHGG